MKLNNKKYKTIFIGTPGFAIPSLKALIDSPLFDVQAVITQPDKPGRRGKQPLSSPIKKEAEENNIKVLTPEKIKNNLELFQTLKDLDTDIIVVVAYGKILPQEILDIPRFGVVNIHGSILPKYRGASPIAASILNGDVETGVTLMKMELEMDAGPIIAISQPITITKNDTIVSLSEKMSGIGAEMLIKYLPQYLESKIIPQEQDDNQATYVKLITKQDGVINWQELAEVIERKVRAYWKWPSAFTRFNNKLLKIFRAEVLNITTGKPGIVWLTDDKYPAVNTSAGSLKLLEIQLEGKKTTYGKDFIVGHKELIDSQLN